MADLTDEINKSSREFSETTKKFNAEFKSLIGNVRDVNQSLGDSFADLRKDQANTFAGALQAKKTKEILKEFETGMIEYNGQLAQILSKDLPKGFKDVNQFIDEFNEGSRRMNFFREEVIKFEEQVADQEKIILERKIAGLNEEDDVFNEELKRRKENLEETKEIYDEISEENEKLVKHIKKNTKDAAGEMSAGFESFDKALQELFGFGISPMLDTIITKTDAISKLFEGFGSIGGNTFSGLFEGVGQATFANRESVVAGAQDRLASFAELGGSAAGTQFKEEQARKAIEDAEKLAVDEAEVITNTTLAETLKTGLDYLLDGMQGIFQSIGGGSDDNIIDANFDQLGDDVLALPSGDDILALPSPEAFESMNALPELAGSAIDILPDMKNLGGATKNATAGLGRMAPALIGSAGAASSAAAGTTALATGAASAGAATGTLAVGMGTLTAGVLLAAGKFILIGAIVFAVFYAMVKLAAYLDSLSGGLIGEGIGEMFGAVGDFFGTIKDMFTGEQTVLQGVGNTVGAVGDFVMGAAKTIGGQILGAARAILPEWALKLLGWDDESMAIAAEEDQEMKRIIGEKDSRRSDQQLENAAMESGLLVERNRIGKSKLDLTMLSTAPTDQLQRLARLDDFDEETTKALNDELTKRADFKDAFRFGDEDMSSEEVARKRFELGEISEDMMNQQINNANNNQNLITNNNSTTITGEQTTHPSDPMAAGGNMHLKPI